MTTESIMTPQPYTLRPTDKVSDALLMMHKNQVRNLPVVDEDGSFVGLFGIRRLSHLLLPTAAQLDRYSLADLSFMPDDLDRLGERLGKIGNKPVSDYLEKKKNLIFCKPSTSFPELLELLANSRDASLPVIVVTGKKKKLAGIVSAWDVLDRLIIRILERRRKAEPHHPERRKAQTSNSPAKAPSPPENDSPNQR